MKKKHNLDLIAEYKAYRFNILAKRIFIFGAVTFFIIELAWLAFFVD